MQELRLNRTCGSSRDKASYRAHKENSSAPVVRHRLQPATYPCETFPCLLGDVDEETCRSGRWRGRVPGQFGSSPNAMTRNRVDIRVGEAPDVQSFLAERIYEFNAKVTGYFDGESFSAIQTDGSGINCAGVCGYTWGGCAYVSFLWVDQSQRGRGLGSALLAAAEEHAKAKGCKVVFLATHSFQAPGFYERRGYKQQAMVADHPVGHKSLIFAKALRRGARARTGAEHLALQGPLQ